jgi:hypothetical protein
MLNHAVKNYKNRSNGTLLQFANVLPLTSHGLKKMLGERKL